MRHDPRDGKLDESVRIIGGRWRRRKIGFCAAAGIRPTPDRVRETLFNWLAPRLAGARCLDLFAGSGILGLEAASRGASEVTLVDVHERVCETLRMQVESLGAEGVEVVRADACTWLARGAPSPARAFDVAFVDPPFGTALLVEAARHLQAHGWLAAGAHVYLESAAPLRGEDLPAGWEVVREKRAGRVRYYLALALQPGSERRASSTDQLDRPAGTEQRGPK